MEPLLTINQSDCSRCYACVRTCPVKAIQLKPGSSFPVIEPNRCIACGSCISICSPRAIKYRSGIAEAQELFTGESQLVAIISPSISAEFDDISDYRKFATMIRSLGISHINEISFAVDLLAYKYLGLLHDFKGRYYLASVDPVLVSLVEKFHPNLISNLAPLASPMIIMTRLVRLLYGQAVKVIYIGPDIASKEEMLKYENDSRPDVALTFEELRRLFEMNSIEESNLEYSDFDPPLSYKGSLYPLRNGLLQAADIDENLLTSSVVVLEGKKEMLDSIAEFEKSINTIQKHFCLTFGNSLEGPGMTRTGDRLLKEHLVIKYANKRLQNFFRVEWYDNLQKYLELDFSAVYAADDQRLPPPPDEKVIAILAELGKNENDTMGCLECGYSSCLEFARDVAHGITTPEMCVSFAMKNTVNYESSLHEMNEKLAQARRSLRESEEKTRLEKESALQASELTNAMLEKLRAGVVIVDNMQKIVKANTTFTNILGEDAEQINEVIPGLVGADLNKLIPASLVNLFSYVISENESIENRDLRIGENLLNVSIFPIVKGKVAGGIIRDMRAPEVQRAEVINRITEVIDRNLEMVQKIGFLLGEGATDIERMLNSIIEFYKGEKKNN